MFDNYPSIPYVGFKDENVKTPITFVAQHQNIQPGMEYEMKPSSQLLQKRPPSHFSKQNWPPHEWNVDAMFHSSTVNFQKNLLLEKQPQEEKKHLS